MWTRKRCWWNKKYVLRNVYLPNAMHSVCLNSLSCTEVHVGIYNVQTVLMVFSNRCCIVLYVRGVMFSLLSRPLCRGLVTLHWSRSTCRRLSRDDLWGLGRQSLSVARGLAIQSSYFVMMKWIHHSSNKVDVLLCLCTFNECSGPAFHEGNFVSPISHSWRNNLHRIWGGHGTIIYSTYAPSTRFQVRCFFKTRAP